MAAQHAVVFSSVVGGAAIVAGSPYGCGALGNDFDASCNYDDPPIDVDYLHQYTASRAAANLIDPIENLATQQYYLYVGTDDSIVYPDVMYKAQQYFATYVPRQSTEAVFNIKSEHGDITDHYGVCCNCLWGGYILNCRYDQAGAVLARLEGRLQPKVRGKAPARNLKVVSQRQYKAATAEPWWVYQMMDDAYVYQPSGCATAAATASCKLHVLYHGCGGGGETENIIHVGYLEYAESNNIIIVFPQSKPGLGNLGGCWDWWGITGTAFDTHDSLQLNVVMRLINDLPNVLDDAPAVAVAAAQHQTSATSTGGGTSSTGGSANVSGGGSGVHGFASMNLTTASRPRPSKFSREKKPRS